MNDCENAFLWRAPRSSSGGRGAVEDQWPSAVEVILQWLAGCLNRPCFHRAVRWSERSHCSETTLSEAIDGRPDPILYGEMYCNGSCSEQSQMHIYIFIIYINICINTNLLTMFFYIHQTHVVFMN